MALDEYTFRKRHYQAIHDEWIRQLRTDSRKVLMIWNGIFRNRQRPVGTAFTYEEITELMEEYQRRIDGLMPVDIIAGRVCIGHCALFRDPDQNGVLDVTRLAGGFDLIRTAPDGRYGNRMLTIVRDRETGEEFVLKDQSE